MVLACVAAVAFGGCGGEEESPATETSALAVPWVDPDGDPPIIGSLSVNPADSTLFMGTNTGLFRIPDGAKEPEKVTGELSTPDGTGKVSESLVVRFTGPDELLASGHPAAGEALPPQLGLISSDDAGATWSPVSELGTADFHAIEPAGDTLVAALFQQPQVLVSEDDGRNWETRAAPAALVSLEVDPDDPAAGWAARTAASSSPPTAAGAGGRTTRSPTSAWRGPRAASSTGSIPAAPSRCRPTAARRGRTAAPPAASRRP